MKFRSVAALAFALSLTVPAHATISFFVNGDQLLDSLLGSPVPDGTAVMIVAALDSSVPGNGTFVNPTPGTFSIDSIWGSGPSSTDLVVYETGTTTESTPGVVDTAPTLTLANGWLAGNRLAIYWFPAASYDSGNQSITLLNGDVFGTFNNQSSGTIANPATWVTPADGSSGYVIAYLTPGGIDLGPGDDVATFGSVPEPSTFALLGGVVALGAVLRRRLAVIV